MSDASAHPPPGDAALAAFLRGIERRGYVLAEAQCGDPVRAQAAIDAATRAFRAQALTHPLAGWPALFWQVLLAQPVLRESAKAPGDPLLARLSPGPRAALLLRLVAGLDAAHGADVLRVSPDAYRHALYRALHDLHSQGVADADLRVFRERLQARAKHLPDPAHRSAAPVPQRAPELQAQPVRTRRGLRSALMMLLAIAVLAFAASFFWKPQPGRDAGLLRAQPPAATLPAAADLIASPDFQALDDPDGARLSRDLDVFAWYAAGADADSPQPASASSLPESATPDSSASDAEGNAGGK